MTSPQQYLVSYGATGFFGLFTPVHPGDYFRGSRVLIRSHRGQELGTVLCEATPGHVETLAGRAAGKLLGPATLADEARAAALDADRAAAFEEARRLVDQLGLPLEILDVEAMLEPRALVIHYLGDRGDPRPFVSALSKRFNAYIELQETNLDAPETELDLLEAAGCGGGECGACGGEGGGCGSCRSGSCGSCSEHETATVKASAGALTDLVEIRSKLRSAAWPAMRR